MRNPEVAAAFMQIAALLELKGESPFKIRAYRAAAATIQSLVVDVAEMAGTGGLLDIPGIGKALAAKIDEYLRTGRMAALERLQAEVPAGLLHLVQVPGIGPKLAFRLYQELGITDMAGLAQAVAERRLRGLKGLGEKTELGIARALQEMAERQGRRPLGEVLPVARELAAHMEKCRAVEKVSIAGSLRRLRETVKDVDLVAAVTDAKAAADWLLQAALVDRIVERGNTKVSVVLHNGLPVDTRLVEPDAFASALHHFTGGRDHHIALRELARRRGLSINEYGMTDLETGARVTPGSEAELYALLDLPYIPPELREGQGEVAAALQGALPALIELGDIQGDLHVHSTWSDGDMSLADLAAIGGARGLAYIAVCDHSPHVAVAGGLSVERLRQRNREICLVNENASGAVLLAGVEVDILNDGNLDYPDEILAGCDVVVASIHTGLQQEREQLMRRLRVAMQNPYVHIIGHPSGRLLGRRAGADLDYPELIRCAAQTGTALEINANPSRLDLPDVWARQAAEAGVLLAVNTDAHDERELDMIHYGLGVARRAWLTPQQVANCRNLAELRLWLAAKRTGTC